MANKRQVTKFTACAKKAPKGKGSGPRRRVFMKSCLRKK